jgi:hypothetical protein
MLVGLMQVSVDLGDKALLQKAVHGSRISPISHGVGWENKTVLPLRCS